MNEQNLDNFMQLIRWQLEHVLKTFDEKVKDKGPLEAIASYSLYNASSYELLKALPVQTDYNAADDVLCASCAPLGALLLDFSRTGVNIVIEDDGWELVDSGEPAAYEAPSREAVQKRVSELALEHDLETEFEDKVGFVVLPGGALDEFLLALSKRELKKKDPKEPPDATNAALN